ncbi:MAG: dual specificity protein phosphatase family protein [Deltaproteobacteria bacterium]|nr:dual specificity protein phosphatase family protein [Candidatus Zymogenaceae bacterium]
MLQVQSKKSFCEGARRDHHRLYAMALPGLVRSVEDDLKILIAHNVGAIVTMTQDPLILPLQFRPLFAQFHMPVENFEPPTIDQIGRFVDFVNEQFDRDINVAVHCLMGIGRTGTAIAAYRVSRGETPDQAIEGLRKIRNFIETKEQEEMVWEYYRHLRAEQ